MTSLPLNVTFDCLHPPSVAHFWSQVTGWPATFEDMPGNPYWAIGNPDGPLPRLVFVEVSTPKSSKNRVHLDLVPGGLLSLGGRGVEDRRDLEPGGWIALSDVEGNEFCLEGGED